MGLCVRANLDTPELCVRLKSTNARRTRASTVTVSTTSTRTNASAQKDGRDRTAKSVSLRISLITSVSLRIVRQCNVVALSDIDECDSSPCQHGECKDGDNMYECVCHDGWTGIHCDCRECFLPSLTSQVFHTHIIHVLC